MRKLSLAKTTPIIIDACILMVGIEKQDTNKEYCFDKMKECYIKPLFEYFEKIKIHEMVWIELDDRRRDFINSYIGKNVGIVCENGMYGKDPLYTTIFNEIAEHELFNFRRGQSKNRGDVFSLAYAAYHKIPFFSTKDTAIIDVVQDISHLKNLEIIGFEYVLTLGYLFNESSSELNKRLSSLYKSQCGPLIIRKLLPATFNKFLNTL
jgi:hypothetical protein